MKRTRYRPKARRDLEDISERIAVDNLDAAIQFCLAVEDAAEKLAQFPGMRARHDVANPRLQGLRSWPIKGFRKYLLFYIAVEQGTDVIRVLHGARDLDVIFSEE